MTSANLLALEEFCDQHHIDPAFVHSLHQAGLVELITSEEVLFIEYTQLPYLEKYVDFHYHLDINLEGIETISYLLRRIKTLQEEVIQLKNHLHLYESRG